jgi:hypothetical protein
VSLQVGGESAGSLITPRRILLQTFYHEAKEVLGKIFSQVITLFVRVMTMDIPLNQKPEAR